MLSKADKEALKRFQNEYNRSLEEEYARTLAEREYLRLFFINENQAYTDGRNIIIDPAWRDLFADIAALALTEEHMKLDDRISSNRVAALKMMARAQNIHETLHVIFTNFPSGVSTDKRATTKARAVTLSLVSNIIEDAFIEAAGCSEFDNMEPVLMWFRVAMCCANVPTQGTVERAFAELEFQKAVGAEGGDVPLDIEPPEKNLMEYLSYMASWLLYPMVVLDSPPEALAEYVDKTKVLFAEGSSCGNADARYTFAQNVFDIIEPLIPDSEDMDTSMLEKLLNGTDTHGDDTSSLESYESKGKDADVTRRLFTDLDGNDLDGEGSRQRVAAALAALMSQFAEDEEAYDAIFLQGGGSSFVRAEGLGAARMHDGIRIEVIDPKIDMNLKRAYQNIYRGNQLAISTWSSRFAQLLQAEVDVLESKQLFGSQIESKRLGDTKKRYWARRMPGIDAPELAVLLLIDGSGSMGWDLREGAMAAAVVLHEVLDRNNIPHAIVEHRAIYGEPLLEHKMLVGFGYKKNDKYNIPMLEAREGTREGLTLYWAENYLSQHTSAENKVILMISDGEPAHSTGGKDYYPPVSNKDTANAVAKISQRGTNIIAIALDDNGEDCVYQSLFSIYPNVVPCTDTSRLPRQICKILTKLLSK